jgi:protein phosphatase PTC1
MRNTWLTYPCTQLWDVCSDQEAVDLVRQTHDPQAASKALVDHALARFSTDNLSCMIVRFDNAALRAQRSAHNIGVEGDPETLKGTISEADAIVGSVKRLQEEGVVTVGGPTPNAIDEREAEERHGGEGRDVKAPELNPEAVEEARRKKEEGGGEQGS